MKVTLLGIGLMGGPLAQRLGGCGHHVRVWNRSPSHATYLEASGVELKLDVSEAVAGADVVVLTLSNAEAIQSVLGSPGVLDALKGGVVVQMGTISPQQSRALASQLAEAGVAYLEAPVLGSRPEAANGTLQVMAGGEPDVFNRCLPLLKDCGSDPILVGPVGQAATLKLALNQLIAALTSGFALSLGLVRREGLSVELFLRILRASALYAPTFDKKLDRMLSGDYTKPNFPLRHLLKDAVLCQETAKFDGLRTEVLDAIVQQLTAGIEAGHGNDDYSSLALVVDPLDV